MSALAVSPNGESESAPNSAGYPKLHVFGDSHSVACFDRFRDADVYWLGPRTMYWVGREKAGFVERYVRTSSSRDIFVFVFGEIDVRCHIGRIAALRGTNVGSVILDLAHRFLDRIDDEMREREGRVVICSVVPPSEFSDRERPTYGPIKDRVAITRQLNALLREGAYRRGMIYLDYFDAFADKQGRMRSWLSDGTVHVGLDHTRLICRIMARTLGEPIRYRWDMWLLGKLSAPVRWLLVVVRPRSLWRFNKKFVNVKTVPQSGASRGGV